MADFEMCNSVKCPMATTCGRNAASGVPVPSADQKYLTIGGFISENEKCKLYWKVDRLTELKAEEQKIEAEIEKLEAPASSTSTEPPALPLASPAASTAQGAPAPHAPPPAPPPHPGPAPVASVARS